MINKIKEKVKKFWKWLLIGGIALVASGEIIMQPTIPSIIAEGQKISFIYTDNNSNENLIIYTDKEIYTPLWAWNGFDVYVAIENKSGESQPISFQSFFSKDFSIEEVSLLNPNATSIIKEPVHENVCSATSTECQLQETGKKDVIALGVWIPIAQQQFSKEAYDKTILENDIPVKQKIGDNVEGNFIDYSLKDQFSYYKLRIKANEAFSKEEFYLEVIGGKAGYGMLDPTIFTDDFNSYADGDLNTQGGWVAGVAYDVQGTTTYEGAKAIEYSSTANQTMDKDGTARADGLVTIYVKNAQLAGEAMWIFMEGASERVLVRISSDNDLVYYQAPGGAWVTINPYTANVWFYFQMEWRSSDGKVKYNYNGNATSTDWVAPSAAFTNLDGMFLRIYGQTGQTTYIDYIAENYYGYVPPSTAEPQFEYQIME